MMRIMFNSRPLLGVRFRCNILFLITHSGRVSASISRKGLKKLEWEVTFFGKCETTLK